MPAEEMLTIGVASWGTGANVQNKEPILVIVTTGGQKLAFQMPAQTALEMSNGLRIEAEKALPPLGSKPN
jgi:hypothetical protein